MEIRKTMVPSSRKGGLIKGAREREYIYFTVTFNRFRDVSGSTAHEVLDREQPAECECVLCLPDNYSETGEQTPLILSFHGAGGRVCEAENLIGGVNYVEECIEAGYAALDVCGAEPHGLTMGCPEHLFAAYKAYRYAIKHFNLSESVLVAGASMGGHTAMNFAHTFPGIVTAIGMFYPRLNMDGVTVDGHYCIGTWDKTAHAEGKPSTHDRIVDIYRFPTDEWCEANTIGFNPYRIRSFIGADGKRVTIPPCPIKIWQGTADTTVDPIMVEEFVNSVRRSGSYIELHMMEGVAHKISPVMRAEILMWFNRFI
ncbi:MAG: alpha/beta hydrolase [Clostridia bacterium]|nr:alpha/beta hydrolase [Clostridia bacterium]